MTHGFSTVLPGEDREGELLRWYSGHDARPAEAVSGGAGVGPAK